MGDVSNKESDWSSILEGVCLNPKGDLLDKYSICNLEFGNDMRKGHKKINSFSIFLDNIYSNRENNLNSLFNNEADKLIDNIRNLMKGFNPSKQEKVVIGDTYPFIAYMKGVESLEYDCLKFMTLVRREKASMFVAKKYGFSESKVKEAVQKGAKNRYNFCLTEIKNGNLEYESEANLLADGYNLSYDELGSALKIGAQIEYESLTEVISKGLIVEGESDFKEAAIRLIDKYNFSIDPLEEALKSQENILEPQLKKS